VLRVFLTRELRRGETERKGVNILCNGRRNVIYCRARKKTEKRRERDRTTQRRLRRLESRGWTASRAQRLSRHYLDQTINYRQRRVHRCTDNSARTLLDSRINDSDILWRNTFRTAARSLYDGKCDCSAFLPPNFRSAVEKHVHVHVTRCIFNKLNLSV